MIERSDEIIKQLNRLANDRNLPPTVRNKMRDVVQHIKILHNQVEQLRNQDYDPTETEF